MIDVAPLWKEVAQILAKTTDPVEFTGAQRAALAVIAKASPEMYSGKLNHTMSDDEILSISRELSCCPASEKRERFNFIARGIERGNRYLGWDIPLSPFFHSIQRQKNHLQPSIYLKKQPADRLATAMLAEIENPEQKPDEALLGQLLLAAILFGGFLDRTWYQPFITAIQQCDYFQIETWLWLELQRIDKKGLPNQHKRWVADPLTQLLLYRYIRANRTTTKIPRPWQALESFFSCLDLHQSELPPSLSELCRWGVARHLYILPASLLGYAKGDLPATSLPLEAWLRIFAGKAIPVKKKEISAETKIQRTNDIHEPQSTTLSRQITLFKQVRQLITAPDGEKEITARRGKHLLKQFLKDHHSELAPALSLLVLWAVQLLSKRVSPREHRKASALKVRSVIRYWSEIGDIIVRTFALGNPIRLEPQDLEVLYEQMVLKLENSPYGIGRLIQFHGFLETFYQLQPMDWHGSIDQTGSVVAHIDANLICPATYEKIMVSLGWQQPDQSRWQELQLLATILAFRCGLRPGEIRSLRVTDIQGINQIEILVRNNRFKTTKSNAGIRRLPVSILLNQEELDFLVSFKEKRKGETAQFGDDLLLGHPGKKESMVTDKELLDPIRKIICKVTKDQSLRFYHLRHSFLTWHNLMMLLDPDIEYAGVSALEHKQFLPEKRQQLKTKLMGNDHAGQKQQYIQAMFAGHASPKTTHKHYIHLSDWLLGYTSRHPEISINLSYKGIMKLTGISRPHTFELIHKAKQSKINSLTPFVVSGAKKMAKELTPPLLKNCKPPRRTALHQPKFNFPDWAEIIKKYGDQELGTDLKLNNLASRDWELAAQIYEKVRQMDGRRRKTALRVINHALDNYSDRWNGMTLSTYSSTKKMVAFLTLCGIPKTNILIIHHPPRGQSEKETSHYAKKWLNRTRLTANQYARSENSNKKNTTVRGCITIKALASPPNTKKRLPKGSLGLLVVLKIINLVTSQARK